jgi:hypothetical protein
MKKQPNQFQFNRRTLGLTWPESFYSLSHVALPFPPDDEIYGFDPRISKGGFPEIGKAQMVGENGALMFPASLFTRARSNPFFEYMESKILQSIERRD